jgi:hypothetical protein
MARFTVTKDKNILFIIKHKKIFIFNCHSFTSCMPELYIGAVITGNGSHDCNEEVSRITPRP